MAADHGRIIAAVEEHFSGLLREHGPNHLGVGWNSRESQELRFAQLLKVCDAGEKYSLLDYGCGYGALAGFMLERGGDFLYRGIDLSPAMIDKARELFGGLPNCSFETGDSPSGPADYAVSSGIFNVRQGFDGSAWLDYIIGVLEKMNSLGRRGFAFNCLTVYSDADKMREDLYYADPRFLFDICKKRFSRNVALLHDYGLYEFTMIVRKG